MTRHLSPKRAALSIVLAIALVATPRAFAISKDMEQLQTQIKDLQDAVARLQQSNDERMGVLKDLVQQNADSVNKMSLTVESLVRLMHAEQEATGAKLDQASGQVTAVNDSIDEIKARLNRLEKSMQEIQNQMQSINGVMQNLAPAAGGTGAVASAPAMAPPDNSGGLNSGGLNSTLPPAPVTQAPIVNRRGKPSAGVPMASVAAPAPVVSSVSSMPSIPTAPSAPDLYKTALSDYMSAKYPLASSEFGEVIRIYPDDSLAGNSFYYLAEIDYRSGKYSAATKNYDHVLEQFPDSAKVPVSHLHKGMALFALKQNDAGVRELRALIARFPASPEATQARTKLSGMGVPVTPRSRPAAAAPLE
jgi:TolA-binding protein